MGTLHRPSKRDQQLSQRMNGLRFTVARQPTQLRKRTGWSVHALHIGFGDALFDVGQVGVVVSGDEPTAPQFGPPRAQVVQHGLSRVQRINVEPIEIFIFE